jgi:phage baseplate assembly protein W
MLIMDPYLKIPFTFRFKRSTEAVERVPVEESIRQHINLLISSKQGECLYNPDYGYEIWSNEFEPILNMMQWQPKFMDKIKNLLEKYESRITEIHIKEPEIVAINKKLKRDKDYRITIKLDYKIIQTGERQSNISITFEY